MWCMNLNRPYLLLLALRSPINVLQLWLQWRFKILADFFTKVRKVAFLERIYQDFAGWFIVTTVLLYMKNNCYLLFFQYIINSSSRMIFLFCSCVRYLRILHSLNVNNAFFVTYKLDQSKYTLEQWQLDLPLKWCKCYYRKGHTRGVLTHISVYCMNSFWYWLSMNKTCMTSMYCTLTSK